MNVYDSARMADVLAPLGFERCEEAGDADLIILNTCHIREKAAEKVYSELGRLRRLKRERDKDGRDLLIAVAGCVAQAEGEEIVRRAPGVDLVFGPQTYHRLPEMVARLSRASGAGGRSPVIETDFPVENKFDHLPEEAAPQGISAYLTVQEGCDKFCTFCVVPYTRGAEFSRPAARIIDEARRMVASGALEITLLGQNVNAYHGDGADAGDNGASWGLGRLIRRLAEIEGLERLRYTTSHPADMDDDLIAAHGDVPQLMPFVHLPVQSGSDRILAAMNRRHSADQYRRVAARLRQSQPDIALSSDFIVGFPGESDQDFQKTLALVREVGLAQAYSFKYSPRPGTPAAQRPDQVPEPVKVERLALLQDELDRQQMAFNTASVGRILPVLFEKRGRTRLQLVGRSPYMQAVHVDLPDRAAADADIGRIVDIEVIASFANSVAGRRLERQAASAAGSGN